MVICVRRPVAVAVVAVDLCGAVQLFNVHGEKMIIIKELGLK